jgi:hydrogenase nickel incorporation protein HypB
MAAAIEFRRETAYNNIQAVRPGMPVFRFSAKTGEGMEKYLGFLAPCLTELRQTAAKQSRRNA